jgi:hypothetical protein
VRFVELELSDVFYVAAGNKKDMIAMALGGWCRLSHLEYTHFMVRDGEGVECSCQKICV